MSPTPNSKGRRTSGILGEARVPVCMACDHRSVILVPAGDNTKADDHLDWDVAGGHNLSLPPVPAGKAALMFSGRTALCSLGSATNQVLGCQSPLTNREALTRRPLSHLLQELPCRSQGSLQCSGMSSCLPNCYYNLRGCLPGMFTGLLPPHAPRPPLTSPVLLTRPPPQRKKPGSCPTRPPVPFNKQSVLALRLVVFSLKVVN